MGAFDAVLENIISYQEIRNVPKQDFEKITQYCNKNYVYNMVLGDGGESIVLHCVDTILQREIALKIFLPFVSERKILQKNKDKSRFFRGFSLQQLLHRVVKLSIIPDVLSYRYEENPFIVMEYIDGVTLLKYNETLDLIESLRLFIKLALAIDEIHSYGVIHRDIKSDNILVKKGKIVILDWGLAVNLLSKADRITRVKERLGTPITMPPEQSSDAKMSDFRSDIYALACVMHQLITKTEPKEIDKRTNLAIYDPTLLPIPLMPIFLKATQEDMTLRYQTINEMLKQIYELYPETQEKFIEEKIEESIVIESEEIVLTPLQLAFVKAVKFANNYLSKYGENI